MIKKVLIANRGEIALRVMRSCREMGLLTVAVFSDADRTSHHVAYADEAYPIGPAVAKESYLNIEKVIATAKRCGADAIHPGYGFLSENSEFARRCKEEGIIFIGPAAETMEAMGDKIAARKRMIAAGVPVVPGTEQPLQSAEEAVRICNEIGYPVMLKASMGGGGKGMRLIHSESEVVEAYNTARSESMSSFGDDTVYLEKFVEEPHHIEFQILGDNHGNVIHLFDRECSVQRRNQKVVEESPSPFLTPELRREMGEKAVAAAKAVNYSGAGTIEFLVDKNRRFYFLEMNTRLQVEHPITEEVVGVDLVKEQIRIANDEVLHLKQEELFQRASVVMGIPADAIGTVNGTVYELANPSNSLPFKKLFNNGGWVPELGEIMGKTAVTYKEGTMDRETGQGEPTAYYSYGALGMEVAVNVETGDIKMLKALGYYDAGRILNIGTIAGQMDGAFSMGIGQAIFEETLFNSQGKVINPNYRDYKIPTMLDIPFNDQMSGGFVGEPNEEGPYGAKGIGEVALVPVMPAIANAINAAVGIELNEIPMTKERILNGIKAKQAVRV